MVQWRTTRRGAATLVATAVLAAATLTACDPLFDMVVTNPGMFPVFQEGISDYVNRCDPATPSRVDVKAPPGAVVSVNGHAYGEEALSDAIKAAKGATAPIRLIVKRGEEVGPVEISWNGGLRYPRFEKVGKGEGSLDKLLQPR